MLTKAMSKCNHLEKNGIDKVATFIAENYDGEFSMEELAGLVHLSPYHFIRVFKSYTGKTPYQFFLDERIKKAKELLRYNKYSITEVCFLCNFKNTIHFASVFKRKVGMLPSAYRKSLL